MVNVLISRDKEDVKPKANTLVELIHDDGVPFIVLMTSDVKQDGTFEGVAFEDARWTDQFEIAQFRVFDGKVTLSNKED
ncbi:hypothetical protein QE342_gp023 [Pseudomonas phage vB_PaeS_B8]|uniref:Uncharacterized protein n=14 Tax=Viruses TaxID=10239 RepID=A0A1J0ME55_9CAUD|nr:hypothetical protein PJG4_025 [Pseudomonas phage JG004]YP_008857191.1 hypothetical protein X831_gp151 [Pseudomonas phage PAK_P2]YP_008859361.1 hypothetical protein PAK_P400150 [Pseudomonas phage PAK_P4]YP_009224720.1 hypothetical protein PaoP5_028 [Pseudomonas phage PaoP5]YP_009598011.1 hypothetical protein FDH20_gp086 [Pseudomonas phage PA10]YP_009598077.1 hypothetical protein FDH21_gp025 [Pseudomonas phage Zigelbrucke]YP_009623436.1 hypothetical protein FDJ38_gp029 [Pseudomonas phage vB_